MGSTGKTGPEKECREILDAFQGVLSWKWDDRFEMSLAEFGADKKDRVREIIDRQFINKWTRSSIGKAPDAVRAIDKIMGKLRPGQMLFTSEPKENVFIFCAWWPWGDGKTISVRVAPYRQKTQDAKKDGIMHRIKKRLGI